MNNVHRLYSHFLEKWVQRDQREALPDNKTRIDLMMKYFKDPQPDIDNSRDIEQSFISQTLSREL